jgi:hypothetical protein
MIRIRPHPDTDRDSHALDAEPDPAKRCQSGRILIHITPCNGDLFFYQVNLTACIAAG